MELKLKAIASPLGLRTPDVKDVTMCTLGQNVYSVQGSKLSRPIPSVSTYHREKQALEITIVMTTQQLAVKRSHQKPAVVHADAYA